MDKIKGFFNRCGKFLDRHKKLFLGFFVFLIIVRLWLFLTMNWQIELESYYDSRLEINSAVSMSSFEWAGEYSKFALCKGLSFPIFVTILYWLRIPYPVGLFLLAFLAAFLFARAVKPVVPNSWVRKLIFLFLLYNPVGLGGEMTYPYRNALVPFVVLIVISCVLALYLRRKAEMKKLIPWGILGLIFAGFFWNLREDSVWFLPFLIAGAMIMCLHYWIENRKKKTKDWKRALAFALITIMPILGILIWNTAISITNQNVYGVYTTQDRTKTYEAEALGALIRIDDGADLDNDYWVSSEALELAKGVSPTLASLDLAPFDAWPKKADYSIWAFRDSMANSGYYRDATETNLVYQKIYDELEEGFSSGILKRKNGVQLSDTSGIYSANEMTRPIGIAFHSLINHAFYDEYKVELEEIKNVKNEGDLLLYENVLGSTLLRSEDILNAVNADEETRQANNNLSNLLRINKKISNAIIKIFNFVSPVVLVIAVVGVVMKIFLVFKNKNYSDYSVELVLFVLGIVAVILFYSYTVGLWGLGFNLTANSSLFKSYTTPQTLMMSVVEVVGLICLFKCFVKTNKKIREKK